MPFKQPSLTIIEGQWFADRHVSTLQLFQTLFAIWTPSSPGACYYEMFTSKNALADVLKRAFEKGSASTIYVAAHGCDNAIFGRNDQPISRTVLLNSVKSAAARVARRGILFGACLFGRRENADFLMKSKRIQWVAGYEESPDWIDSTLLDVFFLQHFLFPHPGSGPRQTPSTAPERLAFATQRVRKEMGGLSAKLKFRVWARERKTGDIRDLMA
jgi:hypothetical protein